MEKYINDSLENVLANRFERYSKYIIQNRALPDARDGLKPVQRRILWDMYETGNTFDKSYHKSAKTVGDVMGKYHPHGDCLWKDTLIHMADGTFSKIEDLAKGNKECLIYAYDVVKNREVVAKAFDFRVGQYTNTIYNIILENQNRILCTANHPFLSRDKEWIKAENLKSGDFLMSFDADEDVSCHSDVLSFKKSEIKISEIIIEKKNLLYPMYDFTVEDYHNMLLPVYTKTKKMYISCHNSSIYDAMVRMSQPWKVALPLIDMQGNNGSIDDDPAAAMRYTESRLSKTADLLLRDIEKNTVDWTPNYSDDRMEPTVLPASYPNLLVGGISGIASGYATNIPTHNLLEVIKATIYRIQNKNSTIEDIMEIIPGPDFPTGGIAMGKAGIKEAFETGKGKVFIRANCTIEKNKTNQQIIISEIPYEVVKSQLVKKIDSIRIDRKIEGIVDVKDETDRKGLKIVIDLKKEANAPAILNYLYKNTDLQVSYNYNMVAIFKKSPKQMNILDILDCFIEHREDVVKRRTEFDLKNKEKRLNILNGLIKAISSIDEVVKCIRASKNKSEAKEKLEEKFSFTSEQSEAVVSLALYRLTNTDIKSLMKEKQEIEKQIVKLKNILKSKKTLDNQIIREMNEILIGFPNHKRKTKIIENIEDIEVDQKEMISKENVMVTVSKDGYIKKCSRKSYVSSAGISTGKKASDEVMFTSEISNSSSLLLFTSNGNVIFCPVFKFPEAKWKDVGIHLSNFINMDLEEKIIGVHLWDENKKNFSFIVASSKGQIKKTDCSCIKEFNSIKKQNLMILKNNDTLISTVLQFGNDHFPLYFIMASKNGFVVRYKIDDIPFQKNGKGVKGMKLSDDDEISYIAIQYSEKQTLAYSINNKKRKKLDISCFTRPAKGMSVGLKKESETVTFSLC